MDIDLLSKMVKEAVIDHDTVTLPGMGSFVAEWVPATFADRGYTILPPYRRLYFSPREADDRWLPALYARANDVSEADAERILKDFLIGMKEVLKQKKIIVFPGLGRLRATLENHFFFVADEELDIYPSGFGLQPISLKTHEESKEAVAEAVSSLAKILEPEIAPENKAEETLEIVPEETPEIIPEEVPEIAPEETTDDEQEKTPEITPENEPEEIPEIVPEETPEKTPEETPEVIPEEAPERIPEETPENKPEETPENDPEEPQEKEPEEKPETKAPFFFPEYEEEPAPEPRRSAWKGLGIALAVLAGIAVLALVALAVVGRVAPAWLDGFLYSPEELELLRP